MVHSGEHTSNPPVACGRLRVYFGSRLLVITGGVNHSADSEWVPEGPTVRMVVPCDFQKDGLTYLEDER